jgi:magnesium-transporting ATPase (P-type)
MTLQESLLGSRVSGDGSAMNSSGSLVPGATEPPRGVMSGGVQELKRVVRIKTGPPVRHRRCCLWVTEREQEQRQEQRQLRAQGVPRAVRQLCAFAGNYVQTNKYTLLTFPFLALRLQFQQVANVYFLFIAVFYAWERVSPVTGISRLSGAISLAIVLIYALVLEAIQDLRRWRQDQAINDAQCRVLAAGAFVEKRWKELAVGDIVKVAIDETVPADLLFLVSENKDGLAYLSTASLDGETNLKVFEAHSQLTPQGGIQLPVQPGRSGDKGIDSGAELKSDLDGGHLRRGEERTPVEQAGLQKKEEEDLAERLGRLDARCATLSCELPNAQLYEWAGSVDLAIEVVPAGAPRESVVIGLGPKQLLLRGAVLRKTRWIVGMVVYAGAQSKLQMNDDANAEKSTNLMRLMQVSLAVLIAAQLVVCVGFASVKTSWDYAYQGSHVYLLQATVPDWTTFFLACLTFILLLCYMVPISLIMSIQTVKNIQKLFLDADYGMYHAVTDTPATARSATLHEELGQVRVIFSDKTGTLTCNEMELLKVYIHGEVFGGDAGFGVESRRNIERLICERHASAQALEHFWMALAVCHQAEVTLRDDEPLHQWRRQRWADVQRLRAEAAQLVTGPAGVVAALRCLVTACEREREPHPPELDVHLEYSAASPDDKALVEGAAAVGCVFLGRRNGCLLVRIFGQVREFEILCVLPFDSERKRMSVLVSELVPEVEAAYQLTEILAQQYDAGIQKPSAAEERMLNTASPVFAEAHRQREMIITQHKAATTPVLWSKGADTAMQPRLVADGRSDSVRLAWEAMQQFAKSGLRTLVVASRHFSSSKDMDLQAWQGKLLHTLHLPQHIRKRRQDDLFSQLEISLQLHGCTAIEDKLQPGVTETLPRLAQAGIAVWVLTGDKTDTAMEIGFSCNLLSSEMNIVVLDEWSPDSSQGEQPLKNDVNDAQAAGHKQESQIPARIADGDIDPRLATYVKHTLERVLREIEEGAGEIDFHDDSVTTDGWAASTQEDEFPCAIAPFIAKRPLDAHPLAVVIHASCLSAALDHTIRDKSGIPIMSAFNEQKGPRSVMEEVNSATSAVIAGKTYRTALELFMAIGRRSAAVLCCRVSPKQKALVVQLGKTWLGTPGIPTMTLAIGDGANDVPMIKEAHIGIGISGHEGMQAVLASDYAIGQFRFLERLLLVHGRACYVRMSKMVLYFLYKSVVLSLTMCWMSRYNGFSGQSLYDGNIASGYNLFFTFFPVIVLACFDRDFPCDQQLLDNPSLYRTGQGGFGFSLSNFAQWALSGVWHSLVLLFGAVYILDSADGQGRSLPFPVLGVAVFSLVHVTVHLKLALSFASHTWVSVVALLFSVATWFMVWPLYTMQYRIAWLLNPDLWNSHAVLWSDARFILALVLLPTTCCSFDVALKFGGRNYPRLTRAPVIVNLVKYGQQASGYHSIGDNRQQAHQLIDHSNQQLSKLSRDSKAGARGSFSGPNEAGNRIVSTALCREDDDVSALRDTQITFGPDFLYPEVAQQQASYRSTLRCE